MPPKLGQQREVPGFWKERLVGRRDVPTWEGDQDDDAELTERPLNVVDKPELWTEGNYLSVGTGSSSAHEKILVCLLLFMGINCGIESYFQAMNVPLQSYDVHRRLREELWTAEKVAENMAKHHAQLQKQRLKAEELKKQAENNAVSAAAVVSKASSDQSPRATGAESSAKETSTSSSPSFGAPAVKSSPTVKAKGFASDDKDASESNSSQQPPPPAVPVDRRFAPEKIVRPPWYRRIYNYTPPPTGWTSDEAYGHRTYIVPHPIHAAKENLMRSWSLVLTPTWKVTKALGASFTSGTQRRYWAEMWNFSRSGGHARLVEHVKSGWNKKMLEETERLEKEKKERSESSSSSSANGGSSASSS